MLDLSKIKDPKVSLDDYEDIPQESLFASKYLVEIYERLGKPKSPFTEAGEKMVKAIIATWEELYPYDSHEWYNARKEYQNSEMSITSQVHGKTGRSLASFPLPIFMIFKKIFPSLKLQNRENCIKMVKRFPLFRFANKI